MRSPLAGRESEQAVLLTSLEAALAGDPRLVLLRGEPGIGKTRLAHEVAARSGEALRVWGLAADAVGAPPYWPWRQVLRALVEAADEEGLPEGSLADLRNLLPDLPEHEGVAPSPEDRFRQFDALTRLLHDVARERPLVVVLEDMHWSDRPSLLLLRHLTRSLVHERLLVLVTTRTTEQRHADVLVQLAQEPRTTVLDLRGLDPTGVRTQLCGALGEQVDVATSEQVHRLTGGNPFFVGQVARAMADARAGRPFSAVTPTVRGAISDRLGRLPQACREHLRAGAVLGAEVPVALLAATTGTTAVATLDLLAEAVAAGLVELDRGMQDVRFVHALVRDAIEADISPGEAVGLHRRAAEAIEALYGAQSGPWLFELARHWSCAALEGDAARAAGWLRRAGAAAMAQLAYEEAARHFRGALHIAGRELAPPERCALLVEVGRALHLAGDFAGRQAACQEAAELALALGRPDLAAQAVLVMEALGDLGTDLVTRRLCDQVLAALEPGPTGVRARVMARRVETYVFQRRGEEIAAASAEAVALAEQSGDDIALAAALRARQVVCAGPEGLEERGELATRMLALARRRSDPRAEMAARLWGIDVALETGDLGDTARLVEALAGLARDVRSPLARFEVARCRAVLAQAQGRLREARSLEDEAFSALAATDNTVRYTFRSALLMNVAHHAGAADEAMRAFEYAGAPAGHAEALELIGAVAAAHSLVAAGRLDEAAALYRGLGPVASWDPPPHVVLCAYAFGLRVALALGRVTDVALLHDLLAPWRGHHVASGMSAMVYFGPVELWLGCAADRLGRRDQAVADLELAAGACSANGAAGFQAEAELELARVLAARGYGDDLDRARELLTAAAGRSAELGAAALADRIARLSGRLEGRSASQLLTPREREVAAFVAEGLTNREIAQRLVISGRTAENHVQHILSKLGLASRSQVAVWVVTQQMSTGSG